MILKNEQIVKEGRVGCSVNPQCESRGSGSLVVNGLGEKVGGHGPTSMAFQRSLDILGGDKNPRKILSEVEIITKQQ